VPIYRFIAFWKDTPSSKNDDLPFFGEGAGDEDFVSRYFANRILKLT
jgi:hypothetical protein